VRHVGLWTIQDGLDPLKMLDKIEIRYNQYEQCRKVISTPESISELKYWGNRHSSNRDVYLRTVDSALLETWVLPKHGMNLLTPQNCHTIKILCLEREYRRAAVAQQTEVEHAVKWHTDTLPVGYL
jgi:hypothetical protein